ncbi:hypothetical protein ACHAW6_006626 [Cyclotella cf. meneghiniana]
MGHLDQCKQGIRSMKSPAATTIPDPMAEPPQLPLNNKTNMVFMTMVDIQVDTNHIKSYPIKSCHRSELLCTYNDVYSYLRMQGYRPQLHTLDNESSHDVEAFITENNASFQYTPPKIHRTNIAERAIQAWKHHFVAIQSGVAKLYCISNWCKDLEQTDITLNMMRPCTQNPNLLAHEALEGMFSFNATPMAPIGTECMIHVKPVSCQTWGYHTIKAWYFAPALNHYRCIKAVMDSGSVHLMDTFTLLHHTLPTPTISTTDCITNTIKNLEDTINGKLPTQQTKLEAKKSTTL